MGSIETRGGLAAGALFVLPGFVSILLLSILYAGFRELPAVAAVFFGLKAAVLAAAFTAIFFFAVPFPLVVVTAGALGLAGQRLFPGAFPAPAKATAAKDAGAATAHATVLDRLAAEGGLAHTVPSLPRALRTAGTWLLVWLAPLALLAALFGPRSVFVEEGIFFSKAAVVTFGGAYAVLAYIAQAAVETHRWLLPGEMLDGLGLAETTPGPLIMVVQFVGFLGAYRHPGALAPLPAGVLGSVVAVWVTFAPCFLWIFTGAPLHRSAPRQPRVARRALGDHRGRRRRHPQPLALVRAPRGLPSRAGGAPRAPAAAGAGGLIDRLGRRRPLRAQAAGALAVQAGPAEDAGGQRAARGRVAAAQLGPRTGTSFRLAVLAIGNPVVAFLRQASRRRDSRAQRPARTCRSP